MEKIDTYAANKTAGMDFPLALARKLRTSLLFLLLIISIIGLMLFKVVYISSLAATPSVWAIYGLITTLFLVSRIPYAYLHRDDHAKTYPDSEYPDVSVVVTAKNEEDNIFKTISFCVNSDYPGKIECIVINDGSTDGTKAEVKRAMSVFGSQVRLISFSKNRGKRQAMAVGVHESLHEVIVFVDSDSYLSKDGIKHICEHFLEDEKVGAVSGNTKVENVHKNYLTRMQSIQYAVSYDIYKASESVHRSVTCCPGCFSAYRKKAIEPLVEDWKKHSFLGSVSTFGDDRGLTNFVLKNWKIVYCEKARATTVVPEKFRVYLRQQMRWKKSWIREGIFASTFMWKKTHPLASLAFYIHFSFPIVGPILAGFVLVHSILEQNPLIFIFFMGGFLLLGMVFALFVRVYRRVEYWFYMPIFSFLFITCFIWQMPYALLTLRKTHWGTR